MSVIPDQVFDVESGVNATVSGLTILGGGSTRGYGEGVHNAGTLTLTNCLISGISGSGVYNQGTATVTDCTISGNSTVSGNGPGMVNRGTLTLTDCNISDNADTGFASGVSLANYGAATIEGCTISGNQIGAVGNWGSATLTDCTISGNSGFGIFNYNHNTTTLTVNACTISGNSSVRSGVGIYDQHGDVTLTDTIVAGNTTSGEAASDIAVGFAGTVTGTYNLIGSGGSGGLSNGVDGNTVLTSLADLYLAPLADNGGPTQTMALLSNSPAIEAGIAESGVTTDQRGQPLDYPYPDIGAVQTQTGHIPVNQFVVSSAHWTTAAAARCGGPSLRPICRREPARLNLS